MKIHILMVNRYKTTVARALMVVSNSFSSPLEQKHIAADLEKLRVIFYIENGILCVLIRIASMRRF